MATGVLGSTARQNATQQTHYLRVRVAYNDPDIPTGRLRQWLPAGAIITTTSVVVVTPFNATTTNVLTCGINANADNIFAAADVDESTAALTNGIKPTGSALGPLAADSQIKVKYTQSGTAATQGLAFIVIHYVPDNDL